MLIERFSSLSDGPSKRQADAGEDAGDDCNNAGSEQWSREIHPGEGHSPVTTQDEQRTERDQQSHPAISLPSAEEFHTLYSELSHKNPPPKNETSSHPTKQSKSEPNERHQPTEQNYRKHSRLNLVRIRIVLDQ